MGVLKRGAVPTLEIYIVSGGMGASAEQIARTALAQFEAIESRVTLVPLVRTRSDVDEVIDRAATTGGLIVHTLVDAELRAVLMTQARERSVPEVDVVGPVLETMADLLGQRPLGTPGLYRKVRAEYFRRIEAIEFAVAHDDGRNTSELGFADIVLIGVSRAGKTPLSIYLAMRGYKTANVPLVKGLAPPEELSHIEPTRVVGLTLEPERLTAYRRQRQPHLGATASTSYSDPRQIFEDLEYARQIFRRGRFATVDVTFKPIEESANEVVALVGGKGRGQG
jgi:regulator of PEP synthase PpsR (kinase-PPPase family)